MIHFLLQSSANCHRPLVLVLHAVQSDQFKFIARIMFDDIEYLEGPLPSILVPLTIPVLKIPSPFGASSTIFTT
jgi:hypothetical protein